MCKRSLSQIFKGRLQYLLIFSFSLVAILTIGLGTVVTSQVINDYLAAAEDKRVERDMILAEAFYQLKLEKIAAISRRIALDPCLLQIPPFGTDKKNQAAQTLDQIITNNIYATALGGTFLVAVLDVEGELIAGQTVNAAGDLFPITNHGNWMELPIVNAVYQSGEELLGTEIIPVEFLAQVGLDEQAYIPLVDTPLAAPTPFDSREGTAGLALTVASPLLNEDGEVTGAALVVYMFNNDFSLVDRIKEVAGVDSVTIFFGDLRVSTNVLNDDGSRAVGTRVSQVVYDTVLSQGQEYKLEAFVVNDWYITRYKPLYDHSGNVVGSLYVGTLRSEFDKLVHTFNTRVTLIALVCIITAGLIAIPISKAITLPITELVKANRQLAEGDMEVQVQSTYGRGELAVLGNSFNNMVQALRQTQEELLHKEKLASMGQLAAGVAHEINNPLGTILLFSDTMYNETPESDLHRKDLKMIIDETNRCKKIVSDLLNFSRQQEVLSQEVNLNDLLDRVIDLVSLQPIYRAVEITKEYTNYQLTLQADPAQLQQAFINLLNNAAESIENSGSINIKTRLLNQHQIEIQISDTGCGIPDEYQKKIFTPFFTTKSSSKGTGLGLSIVYGIIKMHQGQIYLNSKVGEGTTFIIVLPVKLTKNSIEKFGTQSS